MAVVAFLRNFQCDGITKHMECQSNRHKLHLLSESVGQPLYAFVYPSCVLSDTSHIAVGKLKYINRKYFCKFMLQGKNEQLQGENEKLREEIARMREELEKYKN